MFTLTRTHVRDLDRRATAEYGLPGVVLMENAGRGCAELLMKLNPTKKLAVILCGPGNNGGDGFVIARHLDNHGWPATVVFVADRIPTRGDSAPNYTAAARSHLILSSDRNDFIPDPSGNRVFELCFPEKPWVVDALFGIGLTRELAGPYRSVVEEVNASKLPVLAIDIPSGLDCDTGEPLGPTVRATHTATFVAPKRGFLNPKSREWTGQVHVIDIGAPKKLVDEYRT